MKVVYNRFIPMAGFGAMSLFGICFIRKEFKNKITGFRLERMINHEAIHWEQQKELWIIGFLVLYVLEWLYRIFFHTKTAYRGISFEREAKSHENDLSYISKRERFAQWKQR